MDVSWSSLNKQWSHLPSLSPPEESLYDICVSEILYQWQRSVQGLKSEFKIALWTSNLLQFYFPWAVACLSYTLFYDLVDRRLGAV